ncbi:MAG: FliH/SctL family protein, partial [Pseudomonadota bacterium]
TSAQMSEQATIFDRRRFEDGAPDLDMPPPETKDDEPFIPYTEDLSFERPESDEPVFAPLFKRQPASQTDDPQGAEHAQETSPEAEPDGGALPADNVSAAMEEAAADDPASEAGPGQDDEPPALAEEPALEQAPETYSEEDLASARQSGHDEGLQAGLAQAKEHQEARLAGALEALAEQLSAANTSQEDAVADAAGDALAISVTLVKQLFPSLRTKLADREIKHFVRQRLSDAGEARSLKIQVHEDLCDAVTDQITPLIEQSGFPGTVSVEADPELAPGDVRLDWRDGGAERLYETLWTGLDAALKRSIGPTEPSEKAQAARPTPKQAAKKKPAAPKAAAPNPADNGS